MKTKHKANGLSPQINVIKLNLICAINEIEKRDKVIDIIFKYVDKKYHKEIEKKLDKIGWYNKEGNDSIN